MKSKFIFNVNIKMNTIVKMVYCTLLCTYLHSQQEILTESNLPICIITTVQTIVDEPKIDGMLGIIYNGVGARNKLTDPFNHYYGPIGIELRGQTSQALFDKKSYGFETRDEDGEDYDVALLGMPEESDWIFYGPYSDKSLMRNVLIYALSNQINRYATRTVFCELVINGDYKGIYVMMERIKRDKNRINIAKLDEDELDEVNITGGYILRLDKYETKDQNLFYSSFAGPQSSAPMQYQIIYPKDDDVQPLQFQYIKDFMYTFESSLSSATFDGKPAKYHEYVDLSSFVDYMLLNELARNPDAYRISTYFHKQHIKDGGKLVMGPIWDFNIAMGNANFCLGSSTEGWVYDYNLTCPDDAWLVGYWWDTFLHDPIFTDMAIERWFELRQTTFSFDHICSMIDSNVLVLREAQSRNFERWNILGQWIWPNDFIGISFDQEVNFLKEWIDQRLVWMDENINSIYRTNTSDIISNIKIYPNPCSEVLTVEVKQEVHAPIDIYFTDATGRTWHNVYDNLVPGGVRTIHIEDHLLSAMVPGIINYAIYSHQKVLRQGKIFKYK